ncbi:MAG: DUF6443 domain-containing protein [Arachidicoccus sp.]|nr:DUF6443 domain-containing protein [Arachidicoccus sp.]
MFFLKFLITCKIKYRFCFFALFICFIIHIDSIAQSSSQNYIATWTATAPVTDPAVLITKPLSDVKLSVAYFDGLGRPLQSIAKQGSLVTATGASGDIVTPTAYDEFGRESVKYLPYVSTISQDGSYKSNAVTEQPSWYGTAASPITGQAGEDPNTAFSQIVYEASPLNRVLETMAPGKSWVGSSVGVSQGYWINTDADGVRIWDIGYQTTLGTDGFITPTSSRAYDEGTLYKNITTDEAGHQVIEFKDKENHVVLKKVQLKEGVTDNGNGSGHGDWACTYYIYDDLGNLRCVIQPQGVDAMNTANSWVLTSDLLTEQCFRYEYDERNRMIMKQVPGADPVYMVYDNRDRLCLTQDGNMRPDNKWIGTAYDNLNRPIGTAFYNSGGSTFNSILQNIGSTFDVPYNVGNLPTGNDLLTITHYDNYDGLPGGLSATYLPNWNNYFDQNTAIYPYAEIRPQATSSTNVTTQGLVTWTSINTFGSATPTMLHSVSIYDDKGRIIQVQSKNITGGTDVATTQYTWTGQPYIVINQIENAKQLGAQTTVTVTKMTYDDLGRVVKTEMKAANNLIGTGTMPNDYVTLSEIQYDALGEVQYKKLGNQKTSATVYNSNNPLETQTYEYNIRGWLLGVNRAYARDGQTTDNSMGMTGDGEAMTDCGNCGTVAVTYLGNNYFGFDLGYDKIDNNLINGEKYAHSQLTGNIAGMVWKSAQDRKVRKYDFTYDPMNRLTDAEFNQYTGSTFNRDEGINYSMSISQYDNNGNIKYLKQNGLISSGNSPIIDDLIYTYRKGGLSNKLSSVADGIINNASERLGDFQDGHQGDDDYDYDPNGNLTKDLNKNITSISYNVLNLPIDIKVGDNGSTGIIHYIYDAAGNKLQKQTTDNASNSIKVATYIGMEVFEASYPINGTPTEDVLQFFGTSEGRARPNAANNAFVYDYFMKDHLGNTRMVITDDYNVASPILEATSYYPFGLQQKGIGLTQQANPLHNKYTYNGKELQEDLNLDEYDYGARFYDAQIGRFSIQDPSAIKYAPMSPYAYCGGNPIKFIDPTGMDYIPGGGEGGGDLYTGADAQAVFMQLQQMYSGQNNDGGGDKGENGDQGGGGAWKVTNKWNSKYISQFQQQLSSELKKLIYSDQTFTCDDLALQLVIQFASSNNLPFKWVTGSGTFDATDSKYSNISDFLSDIKTHSGAPDFANDANTTLSSLNGAQPGTLDVLTAKGNKVPNHIQVVTSVLGNGPSMSNGMQESRNVIMAQGNYTTQIPFTWRIFAGNNPNSFNYPGVPIQAGIFNVSSNTWVSPQTGSTSNFLGGHYSNQFRNFNFLNWNK